MTKQFITDKYMNKMFESNPKPMTELGEFVFNRTYSRWIEEKGRREFWHETCQRAINYNMNLAYEHLLEIGYKPDIKGMKKEAQDFFNNMYETKQFLSGRTLWVGGANEKVNKDFVLGNFNCSFLNISSWDDLGDLFYLLMVGVGVGFKSTMELAKKMGKIRINTTLTHSEYKPLPKEQRLEKTKVTIFDNGYAKIYVGDSKEGWVQSLREYFTLLTDPKFEDIHSIKISYHSVRPHGERLMTFGGTASGHEPLKEMFEGFDNVLKNRIDPHLEPIMADEKGYGIVRPIHILDMANLIGSNVVIGGVRRTAEICLLESDDYECMFAKYGINGLWGEESFTRHYDIRNKMAELDISIPAWFDDLAIKTWGVKNAKGDIDFTNTFNTKEELENYIEENQLENVTIEPFNFGRPLHHRRMSNNSVAFTKKPERKFLSLIFKVLISEGEPAFVNLEEGARRVLKALGVKKPSREQLEYIMVLLGLNPCVEILLFSYNVCNLTTVNVKAFVEKHEGGAYYLDIDGLLNAQRLSARTGLRMTLATLELPHWNETQKRDRLLGTSLTGWKDAMAMLEYSKHQEDDLMTVLGDTAREEADQYSKELRISAPLLVTAVKPEGTLSQVAGGVSSGLHWSHSPYYIRRIRVNSTDPLAQVALKLGWNVNPEVGTEGENYEAMMKNARTWVIDFPIESGATRTKDDVSAREQFDTYFAFQNNYTEHNSSNTITVRPDEWDECEQIVWDNWDNFVGVSFLQLDGGNYKLAPYEAITKEQYEEMRSTMKPFDVALLHEIENVETETDMDNMESCEGGACPIR